MSSEWRACIWRGASFLLDHSGWFFVTSSMHGCMMMGNEIQIDGATAQWPRYLPCSLVYPGAGIHMHACTIPSPRANGGLPFLVHIPRFTNVCSSQLTLLYYTITVLHITTISRTVILITFNVFGLRNEVIYHLLTLYFLVWFMQWNELINHYFIPYSLIISNNIRNKSILPWHHSI